MCCVYISNWTNKIDTHTNYVTNEVSLRENDTDLIDSSLVFVCLAQREFNLQIK